MSTSQYPFVFKDVCILGSCVSRDAIEFGKDMNVARYSGRQSLVSMTSGRASDQVLEKLTLAKDINSFHQRSIEDDFTSSALIKLAVVPETFPVVIDFIEERVPLGRTPCGNYITLSEAAVLHSNAEQLVTERIAPWSPVYRELFEQAVPDFVKGLGNRPVILHRAFYAPGASDYHHINETLGQYYDLVQAALPEAKVIEVEPDLRKAEPKHKWGSGPYHYIDAYYHGFLKQLESLTSQPIAIKPDFSLRQLDSQ